MASVKEGVSKCAGPAGPFSRRVARVNVVVIYLNAPTLVSSAIPGKNLVFVFPQAPTSHNGGVAGWWKIDVMQWMSVPT